MKSTFLDFWAISQKIEGHASGEKLRNVFYIFNFGMFSYWYKGLRQLANMGVVKRHGQTELGTQSQMI